MENIFNYFNELESKYVNSGNRLIFLDYDGTLEPHNYKRDVVLPSKGVSLMLKKLTSDKSNHVIIISGRKQDNLDLFGDLPVILVGEHGGFRKDPGGNWAKCFNESMEWKNKVHSILFALTVQFDGSFIEEKNYSLTWHYGQGLDAISAIEKMGIISAIDALPYRNEFLLYDQDFCIEFRTKGINKGRFAKHFIRQQSNDFIMAIGDGTTDEDLFEGVGRTNITIKVGKSVGSSARFFLADQREVLPLLNRCAQLSHRLQSKLQ